MLAVGENSGLEVQVVQIMNGDVDQKGAAFVEHRMKHEPFLESGKWISQTTCWLEIEEGVELAIITTLDSPIVDGCPGDWLMRVSVDGRQIDNRIISSVGKRIERVSSDMPFNNGRKRLRGMLKCGSITTTSLAGSTSLNVPGDDLGTVKIRLEAGKIGKRLRQKKELEIKADVGVVDEEKAKSILILGRQMGYLIRKEEIQRNGLHEKMETNDWYRTKVVLELLDVIRVPFNRTGGSSTQGGTSTQGAASAGGSQNQEGQQDLNDEVRALRLGEQARRMTEMTRTMSRVLDSTSNEPKKVIDLTGVNSDDSD